MNFKTYEDLINCINKNISKIPRDIDLVVGIPRSGLMVASIIALYLNIPFLDIRSYIEEAELVTGTTRKCRTWIKSVGEAKHVLIIDDSISSGKAINDARKKIESCRLSNIKYTYLAIYGLITSCHKVDICLEVCEQPRMFEWNYMHHWALEYCCMDIDGVVCEDPCIIDNDDGKRYKKFLSQVQPKYVPTQRVGYFVTNRLDKYREDTEKWLKKYGIEYNYLIMQEDITAKERFLSNNPGKFKAEIYKKTNCILFFESNYEQALEICKISGKPVFCTDKKVLITSDNVTQRLLVRNREFRITVKRIIKKILKKIDYV